MILIGMLHHRKNPETVKKSYAFAACAKAEGAEMVYFSPKCVNFTDKTINGYVYKNGQWVNEITRFPDVIYNTGSPDKLELSHDIMAKLRKMIPFTTNSIGNKMQVYNRLLNDGTFSEFLIPTQVINSVSDFAEFLEKHDKVVFKPVNGHRGIGVTFIEKTGDNSYSILEGTGRVGVEYSQLIEYITEKIKKESYLVQKYIRSKTKAGNSYDFRLHTQKNGSGRWVITAIYPRIANSGSIVSNINSGGSTNYPDPFLKQEFGDNYYNIKCYLEHFALELSEKMDEIQHKYFDETVDELGTDIGIDDSGRLWIYEINWRPGCPPAFYLELDVVKNTIGYCIYLAKKQQRTDL